MLDTFTAQYTGLVEIHRAIAGHFQAVLDAPTAEAATPLALRAGTILTAHHTLESSVLFPGLRRLGRLRSTDVAALDARDAEHDMLHRLCDLLLTARGAAVVSLARDTLAVLAAHCAEEERLLAPDQLRQIVTEAGLLAIGREVERVRDEMVAKLFANGGGPPDLRTGTPAARSR
jgi:hypothetical protein